MKRKESCFHCFTGRREGEGLLRGRTQASPTLATYETHSVTFIHTTSIIPQKHLRAAVFHRGKLLPPPHPTPPRPNTETQLENYILLHSFDILCISSCSN